MENPSAPIALSRSVVLTQESSIPSMLLLGKLVSDGSPADSAASLPDKLRQIWRPSGAVNFWRVTDGTFLVQFNEAGDLRKAHDGAPWPCGGGHDLFLMEHVKRGMNMVDQVGRLTKADLWVRFHGVPADHYSDDTVRALAAAVGERISCDLTSKTSSAEFLRARVRVDVTRPLKRSFEVELENDEQATSVFVRYETVPSLCSSCGVLGHPTDRCPELPRPAAPAASRPQPAAPAASRREKPAVYVASHLGPGRSTSGSGSSSSLRGESSRRYEVVFANAPAVAPAPRSGHRQRRSPVSCSCFSFLKLNRLKTWRKGSVRKIKSSMIGDDSEEELLPPASDQESSAHESVQEPSIMHSHFIVEAHGSRSRKHTRIEVVVETHCSPQLIMGAIQWLSMKGKSSGLDAQYDGNRGVVSIFGLQIDKNTDPVDLIAYLHPRKNGSNNRFSETKPDSPERFTNTMLLLHDANCCKDASKE